MRKITEIIVHCTATPAGREVGVREIEAWHKARGFKTIGYHFVVKLNGEIETGRDIRMVGAHCSGHNTHSVGICYVGGLDGNGKPCDTRTEAQKLALRNKVMELKKQFPEARVYGHCEFANKACPCFDVKKSL